jgi:tetratricopeptide (TPR) repeat protein
MGLLDGLRNKALAKSFYNKGNAYIRSGQFQQAIDAYRIALDCDPKFADAWYNLGIAFGGLGQSEEAIWACNQTLAVDPNYAAAYYNLGVNYTDQGKYQEAIESYEAFLRLAPPLMAPQISETETTIRDLREALASGPTPPSSPTTSKQNSSSQPIWCTFDNASIPYPDPQQTVFFQEIEYGKPIPFDDEERLYIENEIRSPAASFAGKEFHLDDIKRLWCGLASPQLRKVARVRLDRGDIGAALLTCIKLLAACPHDPDDWRLLSTIYTKNGHEHEAQACLDEAERRKSQPD